MTTKKGFTFIEVALVLAVAGLIFIMVFVALPALQRSSRDTTRRNDMTEFIAAVKKYQTNNRGALPGSADKDYPVVVDGYSDSGSINDTSWQGFYNKYLGKDFTDPLGETYKLNVMQCDAQTDTKCSDDGQYTNQINVNYTLLVVIQATCKGEETIGSSNPRNLAVLYRLEGGGVSCNNT